MIQWTQLVSMERQIFSQVRLSFLEDLLGQSQSDILTVFIQTNLRFFFYPPVFHLGTTSTAPGVSEKRLIVTFILIISVVFCTSREKFYFIFFTNAVSARFSQLGSSISVHLKWDTIIYSYRTLLRGVVFFFDCNSTFSDGPPNFSSSISLTKFKEVI